MRRSMWGGLALALLLGLAVPVLADDKADGGWSWWPTWLGGKKKPETKKEPGMQVTERQLGTSKADLTANLLELEKNAYFRRQEAADKMELLAEEAGDAEQVRRVQQLKQRMFGVYMARVAVISGQPAGMDEALLERNLGTSSRGTDLLSGEAGQGGNARTANLGETNR